MHHKAELDFGFERSVREKNDVVDNGVGRVVGVQMRKAVALAVQVRASAFLLSQKCSSFNSSLCLPSPNLMFISCYVSQHLYLD